MATKEFLAFDCEAWLTDPELRDCEREDRSTLIDLMALAHRGHPYGHVTNSSGAISDEKIAKVLHLTKSEFAASKARLLLKTRIFIAEHTGAIYIPRMVRDGAIKSAATEGGQRGGNPSLTKRETAARSKPITLEFYRSKLPAHLQTDPVRDAVAEWIEYRQRRRLVLTAQAVERQATILSALSAEQAVAWITCAIDRSWQGFYPPPSSYRAASASPAAKAKREFQSDV
jgi:hypothetical protein